jgi:hypothetical protein
MLSLYKHNTRTVYWCNNAAVYVCACVRMTSVARVSGAHTRARTHWQNLLLPPAYVRARTHTHARARPTLIVRFCLAVVVPVLLCGPTYTVI